MGISMLTGRFSCFEQRKLKRLTRQNEQSIRADAKFLERRPDRNHRVRLSSPAEVATIRLLHPGTVITPGFRWYTAVRQVWPGIRLRVFTIGFADPDCDVSEDVCRSVYDRGRTTRDAEIEQLLRQTVDVRP